MELWEFVLASFNVEGSFSSEYRDFGDFEFVLSTNFIRRDQETP